MARYRLIAPKIEDEIIAFSDEDAVKIASSIVEERSRPSEKTEWVPIVIRNVSDEGSVPVSWVHPVDPRVPECEAPSPELALASVEDLSKAWRAYAWNEDGHVWAKPRRVDELCLRCGTERSIRWTYEGLRVVEYRVNAAAAEVVAKFDQSTEKES